MTPSPFPVEVLDSGLDISMFVVSLVASLATAGAVIVAIVQVLHARRDVKLARQDAADARRDAKAEARLRIESERTQSRNAERASAERRADRQAVGVSADFDWGRIDDDRVVSGDLHARTSVIVRNNTDLPISDVRVWQFFWIGVGDRPGKYSIFQYPSADGISAKGAHAFMWDEGLVYVGNSHPPEELAVMVEFTDSYLNRWRLDWNGDLTLLTPRRIDVDVEGIYQWLPGRHPDGSMGKPPHPRVWPKSHRDSPTQ